MRARKFILYNINLTTIQTCFMLALLIFVTQRVEPSMLSVCASSATEPRPHHCPVL